MNPRSATGGGIVAPPKRCSRLIAILVATLGLGACASDRRADAEARAYRNAAGVPNHGWSTILWDLRVEVARDREVLEIYADWLDRPEEAPGGLYDPTVLWWLAESADTRHVPTFIRFTADTDRAREFEMAVYGLARTAHDPASPRTLRPRRPPPRSSGR